MQRERLGLTEQQYALPATLIATFQNGAYEHLLSRAGSADESLRRPEGGGMLWIRRATGRAGGDVITVAQLGIGAPAAVLALEEAIARGVRNVLVVGSAGSLQPHLPIGSTVVVEGAEREDGTSHHYLPAGEIVSADHGLTVLLEESAIALGAAPIRGRSWTIDAPYRETVGAIRRHRDNGVAVVEMEAAAIFALAQVRGVRAGLIVAVSDELFEAWNPGFGHRLYLQAIDRAGDAAIAAAGRLMNPLGR